MEFDNHYINRYRSIPAASCDDIRSITQAPYLIKNTDLPETYITLPLHYHPEMEIIIILDGTWQFKAGNSNDYSIAHKGDIVFFMPYEQHEAFISAKYEQYSTLCICFDMALLRSPASQFGDLLVQNFLNNQKYITRIISSSLPEHSRIAKQFDIMIDALNHPNECNVFAFLGGLFTMFGILDEYHHIHQVETSEHTNNLEIQFAKRAIDYTENNYTKKITTSDIASELNYNESYFCRMFRKVFHMRYNDYLQKFRISKTCTLLHQMSIADAAYSCGFTHMGSFSTYFKRYTGMTPVEYRELHKFD